MNLKLASPVTDISHIGPAKAKLLAKLGITHARDFLYTFPRRYDDFSRITNIKDLVIGEKMTVRGRIASVKNQWGFRGRQRLLRIFVDIEDDTGTLAVTWYNLRFLSKQLWEGRDIAVAGTVESNNSKQSTAQFAMRSPIIEFAEDPTHTGRITPVYPETYGVTSRFLRYHVKNLLPLLQALPEYLPEDIRQRQKLLGIREAITAAHFPNQPTELDQAMQRLRFDELFFLQLAALVRRNERQHRQAVPLKIKNEQKIVEAFQKKLPFQLTGAQQTALTEIFADLKKDIPMNRLLQGDVGSGKSAVAAHAAEYTLAAGYSVLYLAPTEILAQQQADSFSGLLGKERTMLLTGSHGRHHKEKVKERLASNEAVCVIGTHALFEDSIRAPRCALVIVDEQHRFGVSQRRRLLQRIDAHEPHLLSMTATPIPRTLNLTVYGDLDVSILNELPPGRQPIHTEVVPPLKREAVIIKVLEQLHAGRQAYVIAPLIEKSDRLQAKSAKETVEEMKELFPGIAIALLHGKMKSDEKESVMSAFNAGAVQLLVSTSVVEVGVNVPNATIMIIEGAERFGLSQLHQFRGRVGRGTHKSYCYVFPSNEKAAQSKRLAVFASTTDGFVIAEEDLKLRGPGEMYGTAQSGFDDLQVASLLDYGLIKTAREEAEALLITDPQLEKHPILAAKVRQKNSILHFE